jgi:hypothetical protein
LQAKAPGHGPPANGTSVSGKEPRQQQHRSKAKNACKLSQSCLPLNLDVLN